MAEQNLSDRWGRLCNRYLPIASEDGKWRLSRPHRSEDPGQGWKLHVSTTLPMAGECLERIAPFLQTEEVLFKAPATLVEVNKLNAGLEYGYSQVGKIFTIYPQSTEEAIRLGQNLHMLTVGLPGPAIPFDRPFFPGSCLYYRYGAFTALEIKMENGRTVPAIRSPDGALIPDSRECWESDLSWLSDPFREGVAFPLALPSESPLETSFRVFRALRQRGKGGVYQAIDVRRRQPRLCILKEGRRHGETALDGRDGFDRVQLEARILSRLEDCGIGSPRVHAAFEAEGNYYLATEFIPGQSLHSLLAKRRRRLPLRSILQLGIQIAEIVAKLHLAGWVWRDCKPGNLIVLKNGRLRPIDFESACPLDQPEAPLWMTPAFAPPDERTGLEGGSADDLYAIGVVFYLLLTGRYPAAHAPVAAQKLRPHLPGEISNLLSRLLSPEPAARPTAADLAKELRSLASVIKVEHTATGRDASGRNADHRTTDRP